MKFKFWQKAYVFTLAIFLLCLNGGILAIATYANAQNEQNAITAAQIQIDYIARSFDTDAQKLAEAGNEAGVSLLMNSYGNYYKQNSICLTFTQNGEEIYSSVPENAPKAPKDSIYTEIDGKRHMIMDTSVTYNEIEIFFAKDVSSLDQSLKAITATCVGTGFAISCALAVGLYFILRKLSSPIEKLKKVTQAVESGDNLAVADENGNDEIADLGKSFNKMIAKINEQMDALEKQAHDKQMLVDNMAHEMRTPLTCIKGYGELLEKANVTENLRITAAKYITSESLRLQKISQCLLDSAYIRENSVKDETVSLNDLLDDTAYSLSPVGQRFGVEIAVEKEISKSVEGDPTLLSMLAYNLTENAIKACEKGGKVTLRITEHGFEVADNGRGIEEEKIEFLTSPFYRTDKSRSRADGGAGLGLHLCKMITSRHGAELEIRSKLGEGTVVSVNF